MIAAVQRTAAKVWAAVPRPVRRLLRHELVLWACLLRWVARSGPHGVGRGDTAAGYNRGQTAIMYGILFASVVETVVLALIIPWPLVHLIVLIVDLWGVWFAFAFIASCAVRPHVVGADGSLRVRYGALVDIRIPAGMVASVRADRRYAHGGGLLNLSDDDTVGLAVAGETNVTVELAEPVRFSRPMGKPARARTVRFYADDPRAVVAALGADQSRIR
ncbi:hypothetical protein CLV30_13132 [Haloactinopolyspora alba]|uniref:PH (Pleckstrin Homology) domain-containing protein n=1 Tax=Haloactinopolyspora alba TaxID=648780 RepID=A0A2P8D6Z7_9ACTN|nr:hypothetical protein [Haloactinopolyspora alba]PSK93005.1 hypothetical protein CLV30_13132 [Haloactinopolyspora alba]